MNYDVLQHTLAFHCMLLVSMCLVLSKFVVIFKVQIFCEVIRQVFGRWNIGYSELSLSNAVADPMHSHINSFRFLLLNRICGDANCSGIVAENYSCRLGVSDVLEDGSESGGLLSRGEEGSVFSFSGTARYDHRKTMNSAVYLCWL